MQTRPRFRAQEHFCANNYSSVKNPPSASGSFAVSLRERSTALLNLRSSKMQLRLLQSCRMPSRARLRVKGQIGPRRWFYETRLRRKKKKKMKKTKKPRVIVRNRKFYRWDVWTRLFIKLLLARGIVRVGGNFRGRKTLLWTREGWLSTLL